MAASSDVRCDGGNAVLSFANTFLKGAEQANEAGRALDGLSAAAALAAGTAGLLDGEGVPGGLLGSDAVLVDDMRRQLQGLELAPQASAELVSEYERLLGSAKDRDTLGRLFGIGGGPTSAELDAGDDELASSFGSTFWSEQAARNPLPFQRQYEFHPAASNPFTGVTEGLVDAGITLFKKGRLDEAILAFEAEIAQRESSDVWRWLGSTHAENDDDQTAILCLEKAIAKDADNLEALLDLGVSYTNELFQDEAVKYLELWLKKHPCYASIPDQTAAVVQQGGTFHTQHERLVAMFQAALCVDDKDSDLYTVLGVLFNLSRDYESAQQAFTEAIKLEPLSYSLWNKLGATLANSSRADGSAAAVKAYRKAIELKPTYTRAWVNMGISYSNQSMYDLAAKYYLKALSLNHEARHVWAYLRIALQCMERPDLVPLVQARDVEAFRKHINF